MTRVFTLHKVNADGRYRSEFAQVSLISPAATFIRLHFAELKVNNSFT